MTIIKKFEVEENRKISKKYFFLTLSLLLLLVVLEIWANNNIVTFGDKFENISKLEGVIKVENQLLENEIALHTSLNNISSKSATLGFSSPERIEYIR